MYELAHTDKPHKQMQLKLKLKNWDEESVKIDITHCGICDSVEHPLSGSWGPSPRPFVVLDMKLMVKLQKLARM